VVLLNLTMTKPRAVVYGLKPIGQLIAKVALEKGIELVGAIGIDPSKVGRDVGELIGIKSGIGVRVEGMPIRCLMKLSRCCTPLNGHLA